MEFREPEIMEKYGVKIDIPVLDMLDTGSRQKEVCLYFYSMFLDPNQNTFFSFFETNINKWFG